MKKLLASLLVVIGCVAAPVVREDAAPLEASRRAWLVNAYGIGFGTAFPVAAELMESGRWRVQFITAAHILPPYRLEDRYGQSIATTSVTTVQKRDAAVVVLHMDNPPPLIHIAQDQPTFGDRLWVAGFFLESRPGDGKPVVVLRLTEGYAADRLGSMAVAAAPGCSGGPVLNDRGEAVGILVGGFLTNLGHLSIYEPLDLGVTERLR